MGIMRHDENPSVDKRPYPRIPDGGQISGDAIGMGTQIGPLDSSASIGVGYAGQAGELREAFAPDISPTVRPTGYRGIDDAMWDSIRSHPQVSDDVHRAVSVMVEEAGESLKAVLDYTRNGRHYPADLVHLVEEVEQTAASAIRLLAERLYPMFEKLHPMHRHGGEER